MTTSHSLLSLSWEGFADLCRGLAVRVARTYAPEVVVGIARVGTFPGALIAMLLRVDFQSLRVPQPDLSAHLPPHVPPRETITGRRVLLVDEVAPSDAALRWATAALRDEGAREVRTLLLFTTPRGGTADYAGPEVSVTVLQPWIREVALADRELRDGGVRPLTPP